jgi:hypothetical protein
VISARNGRGVKAVNKKEATITTADIFGKGQNIMVVESAVATRRQTHFAFLPMVDRLPTPAANKPCMPLQMNPFSVLCSGHVIHFTSHVSLSLKNMACRTLAKPQRLYVSSSPNDHDSFHAQSEVFSGQ